jgi:hypothetical protein
MKHSGGRIRNLLVLPLLAGFLLLSCHREPPPEERDDFEEAPDTVKATVLNVGGELFSVPSPIHTAMLVQKSGVAYDKSTLTPPNKVNTYSTDFSRALILGIYGADLGYVSLYNQSQDALGYLAAVKQLGDKLGLSSAFDKTMIERITNNLTNKDSMMKIVSAAYRAGDAYLKDNARAEVGALILAGGWIESMHFSTSAYKSKPVAEFRYRIAEQKQGLNSLLKVLSHQQGDDVLALKRHLGELAKIYNDIRFSYTFAEPRTDTARQVTYINSFTEITVNDDQISRISAEVDKMRNQIISHTK